MAQSIEQFKGLISAKGGMALGNLYAVTLPPLAGVTSRDINLLCKNVNMPGRQIMTQERTIGMKTTKTAYGFTTDDVTMVFHVMNDFGIKQYFETWMSSTIDTNAYEARYKEEYARSVKIKALKKGFSLPVYSTPLGIPRLPSELQNRLPKIGPFDLAQGELDIDYSTPDTVLHEVELINAFPVTLNGFEFTNDANAMLELSVTLTFDDFKSSYNGPVNTASDTAQAMIVGLLTSRL